MNVEKVNSLTGKGDKEFVDGNYNAAIGFYKDALESFGSAGSEDSKIVAILHSKISQAYLKKKEYSHAIESATDSLKADPSFMKSNLRRATANIELDNLTDAMNDLRLIFSLEPHNKTAKDLMKRCSDKPKMKLELHDLYVKHYLRQMLKKDGAQAMGRRSGTSDNDFQFGLVRQSFLSRRGLDIGNYFFYGAVCDISRRGRVSLNFVGWVTLQFMWFKYAVTLIRMLPSAELFTLLYYLLRSKTFSFVIHEQNPLIGELLSLEKYLDVFLAKEYMSPHELASEVDLKLMNYYSDYLTRLIYTPRLADFTNDKFLKAKTLAFCEDDQITTSFLKLWEKNVWPIESLLFVYGVPDLRVLKQFDGVISNRVSNVFLRWPERNKKLEKATYNEMCGNLSVLKNVFPALDEVTILHWYQLQSSYFPIFVRDMSLIRDAYEAISTKPDWCSKLKVAIFVEFLSSSLAEFKTFNVKLLEQSVESLHQKHPEMQIRLCGPRSYNMFWAPAFAVHAVIEFKNEVAQFELAMFYRYPLN